MSDGGPQAQESAAVRLWALYKRSGPRVQGFVAGMCATLGGVFAVWGLLLPGDVAKVVAVILGGGLFGLSLGALAWQGVLARRSE